MHVHTEQDLSHRWTELDGKKRSILSLSEEYSQWTLPHVFPVENSENVELQVSKDSIGAQAVNHLANKVVSTLFPPQRSFFRLHVSDEMKQTAAALMQSQGASGEQAADALAKAMNVIDQQLLTAEKKAEDYMDMVQYRPQAVNVAKLLIITGNALEFHPKDKPVQVYNLRDYSVVRDLAGEVIEIMTRECKAFETFHPEVQDKLRSIRQKGGRTFGMLDDITIYTRIRLEDDGKYHIKQQAEHVMLDTEGAVYTKNELPWIVVTWNLVRGEDYGRGLVADYAGAFHAVNVLSGSLLNMAAITGDIKFLVAPTSLIDIPTINKAPAGSFHMGKKDDVTAIQIDKNNDLQFTASMIERYERQINQAFLLNSALTRNAERVTAEEIRYQANELETSNGGIYSRLASTWQVRLANIVLYQTDFEGLDMGITPKVITGMDSLSRAGELDNMRLFFADIAMLNTVPEDVRAALDIPALLGILGTNRQVEYKRFVKSAEQMQADQDRAIQQQQQLEQQTANRESQVAASREIAKGSNEQ